MKSHGNRKFYHLPDTPPSSECGNEEFQPPGRSTKKFRSKSAHFRGSTRDLMQMIDHNIIGKDTTFQGPFGPRKSVYVDHTASGQPLRCVEGFISDNVLPYYGNTHTTTTLTSSQTTMYRHEAKDIVRNSVGASEHDAVIFCGSGATGAVHKLVQALASDVNKPKPVVFSGPFEHHSNLLPWRDIGAKIVYIPETSSGHFDIEFLEKRLEEAKADEDNKDRLLIGCFSVGSNITGVVTDDVAITILLHKYGGLALWDYAAAAAHVQIVMNPVVSSAEHEGLARKDALYFSGHKFVGGPQTPGVLVAKKFIFEKNANPNGGGGGTVFFVTQDSHRYLKNIEYREEGGTPAIIESIRLGLVFRLKDTVGSHNIVSQEAMYTKKALQKWKDFPEIKILGPTNGPRLPIISFVIQHLDTGYYLHHNFVVALLNDLFGIQTRGGCACAGPYAQDLMGIDIALAKIYEDLLLEDSRLDRDHLRRYLESSPYEIFRPGFTRLSIPFHASMAEAEFVIEAVQLVAKHGWKLLPLYTFNPETGEFHHHANHMFHHRKWLGWASFDSEGIRCKERVRNNSEDCVNYKECLEQAKNILTNAHNMSKRRPLPDQTLLFDSKYSQMRWFLLPSEAQTLAAANGTSTSPVASPKPFTIRDYGNEVNEDHQAQKTGSVETAVTGALSIPKQLLKSCWSLDEHTKLSVNKVSELDSMTEVSTGSELNISSNENESENEYSVPGTIVAGPSICFTQSPADSGSNLSSSIPPIARLCSTNEEPIRDPRLSLDMDDNTVVKDSRGDSYGRSESTENSISSYDQISTTSIDSATGCTTAPPPPLPVCDNVTMSTQFDGAMTVPTNNVAVMNSNNLLLTTSNSQQNVPSQQQQQQQQYVNGYGTQSMCQVSNQTPQNCNFIQQQSHTDGCGGGYYGNNGQMNGYSNGGGDYYTQTYSVSPQPAPTYYENGHVNGIQQQNPCFTNPSNAATGYNNQQHTQLNNCSSVSYDMSCSNQMNGGVMQPNNMNLAVTTMNNTMGGGMNYQHSPQINHASPNSAYQDSVFYPHTPTYSQPAQENMTVNVGNAFEYPAVNWNGGCNLYGGQSPIPVSPHPQSNCWTPVPQDQCHNGGSYPSTPMSPQVHMENGSQVATQCTTPVQAPQATNNSFHSESMKDTMRRVTSELANELKSEIREVISQVEQGIDLEAVRERASSFSSKDKALEGLKSRARTFSGQVLNGNLKKAVSLEGHSQSFDESRYGSSSTPPSSLSLPRVGSVDVHLSSECSSRGTDDDLKGIAVQKASEESSEKSKADQEKDEEFKEAFLRLNMNPVVEADKFEGNSQNFKAKWHCPPKYILKQTLKALTEFSMVKDGDRVLLCLSGGKDSLSMLHIMKQVQYNLKRSGISFTFGAVTVDPGSTSYNPKPLIPYLEALGVPYFYEEQGIMRNAMDKGPEEVASICSFCSRMKRGRIYACARKYGYNVIAMGQHLDDLTESFLMSVFHNGLLRTMKAAYTVKEGDLRLIRPLINVREKALRDFAESKGLPVIPENCPACFDAPKERHRIKQMLAQQEILFPKIYISLRAAMQPLLAVSKTGMETKKTVAKNLVDVNLMNDPSEEDDD